jgi:V-type H+-transporting ATPase subunit E
MKDADVSKQIQQMIRFIRQEAEEKANEISVSAEEVGLIDNIFVKKVEHQLRYGRNMCFIKKF